MFFGVFKDREVIENDMTQNQTNTSDVLEDYGNYLDDPNKDNIDLVPLSSFQSSYTEEINKDIPKVENTYMQSPSFPFNTSTSNINNNNKSKLPNVPPQNLPPINQPMPYPNYNMPMYNQPQYNMNMYPNQNMNRNQPFQPNRNMQPQYIGKMPSNQAPNNQFINSVQYNNPANYQKQIQQPLINNQNQIQNGQQNIIQREQPNVPKVETSSNLKSDSFGEYVNSLNNQVNNIQVPLSLGINNNIQNSNSINPVSNSQLPNNDLYNPLQQPLINNQNQIQNDNELEKNRNIFEEETSEIQEKIEDNNLNIKNNEILNDSIEIHKEVKPDNEKQEIEITIPDKSEKESENTDNENDKIEILDMDEEVEKQEPIIDNKKVEENETTDRIEEIVENKESVSKPFERIEEPKDNLDNILPTFEKVDKIQEPNPLPNSKSYQINPINQMPIMNTSQPLNMSINPSIPQIPIQQSQITPITPIILPSTTVQNINTNIDNGNLNELSSTQPFNNYINPEIPLPEVTPIETEVPVQQPINQPEKEFSIVTNQDVAPGYKACPKCGQVMREDYKQCFVCGTYF